MRYTDFATENTSWRGMVIFFTLHLVNPLFRFFAWLSLALLVFSGEALRANWGERSIWLPIHVLAGLLLAMRLLQALWLNTRLFARWRHTPPQPLPSLFSGRKSALWGWVERTYWLLGSLLVLSGSLTFFRLRYGTSLPFDGGTFWFLSHQLGSYFFYALLVPKAYLAIGLWAKDIRNYLKQT